MTEVEKKQKDTELDMEFIQQLIAIKEATISFLDVKDSSTLRKAGKETSFIVVTERNYAHTTRYVNLAQIQDELVKSVDDRILDLLATQIILSEFRPKMDKIKRSISDLDYTPNHIHLFLRQITKDYLYAFCSKNQYRNLNEGLYNLIEMAITQITVKKLKHELKEVKGEN